METNKYKELEVVVERMLQKRSINPETGCWEYTGYTLPKGYARIGVGNRKMDYAHRVSYMYYCGEIPHGRLVMHMCDNPKCFKPGHLMTGTAKDNSQDMLDKGRQNPRHGEYNGNARLSEDDVRTIRELMISGDYSKKELSEMYNISLSTVYYIITNRRWKHI